MSRNTINRASHASRPRGRVDRVARRAGDDPDLIHDLVIAFIAAFVAVLASAVIDRIWEYF